MIFNKIFLCISCVSLAFSVLHAYILVDLTWVELFNNVHVGIVLRPFVLHLLFNAPYPTAFC